MRIIILYSSGNKTNKNLKTQIPKGDINVNLSVKKKPETSLEMRHKQE